MAGMESDEEDLDWEDDQVENSYLELEGVPLTMTHLYDDASF